VRNAEPVPGDKVKRKAKCVYLQASLVTVLVQDATLVRRLEHGTHELADVVMVQEPALQHNALVLTAAVRPLDVVHPGCSTPGLL
jgi:hypothetical protein